MQMEYNPDFILAHEHTEAEIQNFTGSFCGFVLLNQLDGEYDLNTLAERLQNVYGIAVLPGGMDVCDEIQDLMLDVPGAMVTVSFINAPIPEGEAEAAAMHAVWEGARYAAKAHDAHLLIAVLPHTMCATDAGKLYCRIISAALEDDTALAVYTSGTILNPFQFRKHTSETTDILPLDNLIFIGIYRSEGGNCGYTVGLDAFGQDELELLDSTESAESIRHILRMCAYKMIHANKSAAWYSTFDVDGVQWEGRRKDGVMVEGHSLQLKQI